MPLYLNDSLVEKMYLSLMTDAVPAQIRMIDGCENPVIMTNIGDANLTHPDNRTRLKILVPSQNTLYLGNPFERLIVGLLVDAGSPCCVGFRESDKIPQYRRFEFEGDDTELINAALKHFRLVSPEKYEM